MSADGHALAGPPEEKSTPLKQIKAHRKTGSEPVTENRQRTSKLYKN